MNEFKLIDNIKSDLSRACAHGDSSEALRLLQIGSPVNENHGEALRWACSEGKSCVLDMLFEYGADISILDYEALKYAINNGHVDVVRTLLSHDDDDSAINSIKDDSWYVLNAKAKGYVEILEMINC